MEGPVTSLSNVWGSSYTVPSKMVSTRLRDTTSSLPLAAEKSSRNLVLTTQLGTVFIQDIITTKPLQPYHYVLHVLLKLSLSPHNKVFFSQVYRALESSFKFVPLSHNSPCHARALRAFVVAAEREFE